MEHFGHICIITNLSLMSAQKKIIHNTYCDYIADQCGSVASAC